MKTLEPIGPHDLKTSDGGRGYLVEFFAKRLRRHDFQRYIEQRLAADFACVLSQYLHEHDAAPSDAAQAPLTDEQILRLADACGLYGVRRGALAFAREVLKDAAPVAPQAAGDAAQAPCAWMLQEPGQSKRWYTSGEMAMQHWVSKGAIATPLYAAPVAPAAAAPLTLYVECRQCDECGHIGINDSHDTDSACGYSCGWTGPTPAEDKCPGCERENVMGVSCPKCSGRYAMLAEARLPAAAPTPTVAADAAAPSETCAHDYVRSDRVCAECGEKAAQPDERAAFPYQKTFNAIAAATKIEAGHIAISVAEFCKAFGAAAPQATVKGDERESCWSCKNEYTICQWREEDGHCPHCGVEVERAAVPQAGATLTDEQREAVMEQAQVFASAWSLVGGVFDSGNALEIAEQEKENLRALLEQLSTETVDKPVQSAPVARPIAEYHEDHGNVVWWTWHDGEWLGEPSWIGRPDDSDWPGYHTHWTPHPTFPQEPSNAN